MELTHCDVDSILTECAAILGISHMQLEAIQELVGGNDVFVNWHGIWYFAYIMGQDEK